MKKKCSKCKKDKELSEFYKKMHYSDGLDVWCKSCHKDASKIRNELRKEDKEQFDKLFL